MADGIAITAGSGTTVLTDETASGHAQVVKLAIATDGSATLIPADGTDGLLVNLGANNDVTVTGSALTALQLIDNTIFVDDAAFSLTSSSVSMAGAVHDAALSGLAAAEGDAVPLRVDGFGALWVSVYSTVLPTGASTAANQTTIIGHLDGVEGLLGTIDADTGNIVTSVQLLDDAVYTDDAAFTPGTSKIIGVGFEADESSTDSVDEGDIGAARMTLDRKVITTPQPHTTGGLSISRDIDLDNGTLTVVKNAAGQLYGWTITNTTTATVYVKFYDAASGTLGTGTPVLTIGIPGNSSDDTTLAQSFGGLGIVFATGICVGAGTGVADADNTDPGANGVVANIYYK